MKINCLKICLVVQQQRVSIARAIATNPKFLIADEPTGALDTQTSQEIMNLFKELNRESHTTIILVTHDPHVAEQCERDSNNS